MGGDAKGQRLTVREGAVAVGRGKAVKGLVEIHTGSLRDINELLQRTFGHLWITMGGVRARPRGR